MSSTQEPTKLSPTRLVRADRTPAHDTTAARRFGGLFISEEAANTVEEEHFKGVSIQQTPAITHTGQQHRHSPWPQSSTLFPDLGALGERLFCKS